MSKEPVGSLAEEAARLFAVLQSAADTHAGPAPAEPAPEQEHEHKAGPDCVWCPVCQLINKVRNTSPETIEQLSTAAAHVLGSVRTLLESAAEVARQKQEDAASRSSKSEEESATPSKVDRIDVSEDPEPWD
ncbi:hypothetical protein E1263_40545 [Kribbella antibiotica]|uniref:Uncharacterized protein n=1 Tax=Kribbella antibiotica TaxID=190195 RepID=A0A4R4YI10_9ACTN|nr:hypothetical protein [Kribbella antibiotica]TDD44528.1 hypothetical protein E1263_40545 [Kribbella antibiotica]